MIVQDIRIQIWLPLNEGKDGIFLPSPPYAKQFMLGNLHRRISSPSHRPNIYVSKAHFYSRLPVGQKTKAYDKFHMDKCSVGS